MRNPPSKARVRPLGSHTGQLLPCEEAATIHRLKALHLFLLSVHGGLFALSVVSGVEGWGGPIFLGPKALPLGPESRTSLGLPLPWGLPEAAAAGLGTRICRMTPTVGSRCWLWVWPPLGFSPRTPMCFFSPWLGLLDNSGRWFQGNTSQRSKN